MATVLLRAVLWILAAYHLVVGVLSVSSLDLTARLTSRFYGIRLNDNPQLAYAVRMLGFYALAIGALLVVAARASRSHREIIVVVACLQILRGVSRILSRHELTGAFSLPPRRNVLNAALLFVEAAILILFLPAT